MNDYQEIGEINIALDFDERLPWYCGEVNFNIPEEKIINFGRSRPTAEAFYNHLSYDSQKGKMESYLIKVLTTMCYEVFHKNNIDDIFIITDNKENKLTLRESETKKQHYFVIPKTPNNAVFWQYPIDTITQAKQILIRYE